MRKVILKSLVSAGLDKFLKPAEPFGDCCDINKSFDSPVGMEEFEGKKRVRYDTFYYFCDFVFTYCPESNSNNSWQGCVYNLRYYRLHLRSSVSIFVQGICNGFVCCRDWSCSLYLS